MGLRKPDYHLHFGVDENVQHTGFDTIYLLF
jgi:hypothetical protein